MTATKEKPILMCGPMVRATRGGLKWQTRRLDGLHEINSDPGSFVLHKVGVLDEYAKKSAKGRFGAYFHRRVGRELQIWPTVCPYEVGMRLWVRVGWEVRYDGLFNQTYFSVPGVRFIVTHGRSKYRDGRKPSMFMPYWLSMELFGGLSLEITDVRVQRVQEISEEDAVAEGLKRLPATGRVVLYEGGQYVGDVWHNAREAFCDLWDTLNASRGFGWDVNPWVWVVEFRTAAPEA